jgi:hypothetical protein
VNITPARFHEAITDGSRRHIVPLSGGKDSTALAVYLSQHHPQVDFEFAFCDFGAELPETYEYLDRLEHVLGRTIHRISALELLQLKEKPGRTAFDVMLYEHFAGFRYRGSLDNLSLVVLKTSLDDPDWPGALDREAGTFVYFGENKRPGGGQIDTPNPEVQPVPKRSPASANI